jgi:Ca2+-binding EF-hand superfamily protein
MRQRAIFEELDDDGSGSMDADELRTASYRLGISLDQAADAMGPDDTLNLDEFRALIQQNTTEKRREETNVDMATATQKCKPSYLLLA